MNEKDALTCLGAVEASGLTRREWARANGVDGRSLHCWWLALRDRMDDAVAPMRLVELVGRPSSRGSMFLVRAGRCEVEVGPEFDEAGLLRVLRVALEC